VEDPPSGSLHRPESPSGPAAKKFTGLGAPPIEDRFAVVKVRFEIPHEVFLYTISRAHPELVGTIPTSQNLPDGRVLAEFDVAGPHAYDLGQEIGDLPGVLAVTRLTPSGQLTRFNVVLKEPSYIHLANELEVLLRYPRLVENGEYTVEVAARLSQLRKLVDGLRQISPFVRVLRFSADPMRSSPHRLSPHRSALLRQALSAGYFDVPRRITLTGFAHRLGRSKSSVSRALALIEKELAEADVVTAG